MFIIFNASPITATSKEWKFKRRRQTVCQHRNPPSSGMKCSKPQPPLSARIHDSESSGSGNLVRRELASRMREIHFEAEGLDLALKSLRFNEGIVT